MPTTTHPIPKGYKSSPLGLIPEGWSYGKILDNFDVLQTNKIKKDLPYLEIGDINNKTFTYILKKKKSVEGSKYVPSNVLLISTVRPNLKKITITKSELLVSSAFATIKIENKYLFHYVLTDSFTKKLLKLSEGGTYPTVSSNYLYNLTIALPPLHEQQKIASILNTCDSQIETTNQIIQKLEQRNKGLAQQLLTGKKRLPGFNEKWNIKYLSKIFDRVTRKNLEGNDNVLTISAQKGLINQENFFNKQIASKILDDYFLLYKGEFAYNKSYSNGYPMGAIKRLNNYDKGVVTTLYICFSLKEKLNYSSNFFEKYFESGMLIKGLTQIAHEGGRAHGLLNVTPNDFFNLQVLIPDSKEQQAIADVLTKATQQLDQYKQKLEKLQLVKKGLMQQLLTGKIRVKI